MSEFQEVPIIQEEEQGEFIDPWRLYVVVVKCLKTTRILNTFIFTTEDAAKRYCRWHKANHKREFAFYQLTDVWEDFCETSNTEHILYVSQ